MGESGQLAGQMVNQSTDCLKRDPEELLQFTACLRTVARQLNALRDLVRNRGEASLVPDVVKTHLTDLQQSLKSLLYQYPALNSDELHQALTSLVKSINGLSNQSTSNDNRKRYSEIFRGLDTLEISLGNSTVDYFAVEPKADNPPETDPSPETEELPSDDSLFIVGRSDSEERDQTRITVEEADDMLVKSENGVESCLHYAKMWCKYAKDLLNWMDKRLSLEMEFAKNIMKLAESGKSSVSQQGYMPLQYMYTMAMEHDITCATRTLKTVEVLQIKKYVSPLTAKRNEVEKWRKEFKDQWVRAQKKMKDSLASLHKSRNQYIQRCEELEKATQLSSKIEEEQLIMTGGSPSSTSKQLEKKRFSREEAFMKAQKAEASYRSCVTEANRCRTELEQAKGRIVSHIRKLVYQADQVLKEVSLNLFRLQQMNMEPVPMGFETLYANCCPYNSGEKYLEFIQSLTRKEVTEEPYYFEEFTPSCRRSPTLSRKKSAVQSVGASFTVGQTEYPLLLEDGHLRRTASGDMNTRNISRGAYSDTNSIGGSSETRSLDSPSDSPALVTRKLPKAPSTGTISSDDVEEKEENASLELNDAMADGSLNQGPFRNTLLSKAAQTHRFRKLRGPAKCRECDNYMINGAECEECYLTCHRRCLEGLLIVCGHKRLPSRVPLFGVGFMQIPRDFPEQVPFIITRCTSEIENQAIGVQGLYRVSGSRARVEKLCQAFENGRHLVELSDNSPHDITTVLKYFLKELSEPVVLFELYDEFIAFGKELPRNIECPKDRDGQIKCLINKLRDLLGRLPAPNYNALRHIIGHLYRVSERYEDNKMSANNLGIIFGPTLLRPSSSENDTASMMTLLDSGYQAQIVEFLIVYYEKIFGMDDLPNSSAFGCDASQVEGLTDRDGDESISEKAISLSTEALSFKRNSSEGYVSDKSSSYEALNELGAEGLQNPNKTEAPGVQKAVISETSEDVCEAPLQKPDEDQNVPSETLPRSHFSRQPAVKYSRQGQNTLKPVLSAPPSLPRLSSSVSNKDAEKDSNTHSSDVDSMERDDLQRYSQSEGHDSSRRSSPESSTQQRSSRHGQKHLEISKETTRVATKIQMERINSGPALSTILTPDDTTFSDLALNLNSCLSESLEEEIFRQLKKVTISNSNTN